jgi:hypothetical protein
MTSEDEDRGAGGWGRAEVRPEAGVVACSDSGLWPAGVDARAVAARDRLVPGEPRPRLRWSLRGRDRPAGGVYESIPFLPYGPQGRRGLPGRLRGSPELRTGRRPAGAAYPESPDIRNPRSPYSVASPARCILRHGCGARCGREAPIARPPSLPFHPYRWLQLRANVAS